MNHPGEIARLAALAAPTVALVNNAQREHQEFMQDVEAVARENGSVIDALPASGTVVIPADDAFTPTWQTLAGTRKVLRFGPGGDVHADARWAGEHWALTIQTPKGQAWLALRVAGVHNVHNALAATAGAMAAGAPLSAVVAGLQAFEPVKGRSAVHRLPWQGRTIDAGRRQLQRQPRFGARRHRRARHAAGAALAGARRHGRSRRPGPGLPPRGRPPRARARHRQRSGAPAS